MARRSNSYWANRSADRLAEVERQTKSYELELLKLHQTSIESIRGDMNRILDVFAKNSDLTGPEALKILQEGIPERERQRLLREANKITDMAERAKMMAKVNAPAYRARLKRLEAIELAIETRLKQLAPDTIKITHDALFNAGNEMFFKTMFDIQRGTGLGFSFTAITDRQIESVMRLPWAGKNYSERIWSNAENLAKRVSAQVQDNMVTGKSWRRSMAEMQDLVEESGSYNVKRLLRTETAYVAGETEAKAYEEANLEKYRFVSVLDGVTSDICQSMDGKEFNVKDRETGVNYPPLHPNCRSTTMAVIDGMNLEALKRRAKDPHTGETQLIPANKSYKEWREEIESKQQQS